MEEGGGVGINLQIHSYYWLLLTLQMNKIFLYSSAC